VLRVVCWKWKPKPGYRSTFGPETVNTLKRMVARHYRADHELVCITDDAEGIDKDVRVIPLWSDHAQVPSPHGPGNPSCYRRLKAFSAEAATLIGERFVSIDLDVVIAGDLRPVWDVPEAFKIWGDTSPRTPYNGSMFLMTAGVRRQVWDKFDPHRSPLLAKQKGYWGSDQAWIGYALGPDEKRWNTADGVYSFRNHIQDLRTLKPGPLPENASVVFFHGKHDPWDDDVRAKYGWVREHYR
jgi:hypothetical protein